MNKSVQRFIFLEFTDPKVRKFLAELRAIFEGVQKSEPIHITVRGPYIDIPDPNVLEQLDEEVRGHGVVIGGAGTFPVNKSFVVYLKAQSPIFKRIWWKPDFPSEKFGVRPHVSIFQTNSAVTARAVENFLKMERIEIFTFGLKLAVRTSKQPDLFGEEGAPAVRRRLWDMGRWRVKPGVMTRARKLKESLDPS